MKEQAAARRFLFFFQAEDGIRDLTVTGVQTCALPIWLDREASGELVHVRLADGLLRGARENGGRPDHHPLGSSGLEHDRSRATSPADQIGRASCRERV